MKNDFVYPPELRKLMSRTLVRVYAAVCEFKPDFESKILDIFGNDNSAIDCGMYSLLSKLLDGLQLLSLDSMVETQLQGDENRERQEEEAVEEILSNKGVNKVYVAFLLSEMKTCTLDLIMTRMRRFRAAHRLPKLAARIPSECTVFEDLEGGLQCLIEAISSTLGKSMQRVFDGLMNIKRAQERLSLVSILAKEYNGTDGDDDEKVTAVVEHPDFHQFLVVRQVSKDVAIEIIKDTAEAYLETFWKNYKKLEEYYTQNKDDDVVEIGGEHILTIRCHRSDGNGGDYRTLYNWMNTQNGFMLEQRESGDHAYGFKAYKRPGSLEYLALVHLKVSFNPDLNKQAIGQRQANHVAATQDKSGTARQVMSWL